MLMRRRVVAAMGRNVTGHMRLCKGSNSRRSAETGAVRVEETSDKQPRNCRRLAKKSPPPRNLYYRRYKITIIITVFIIIIKLRLICICLLHETKFKALHIFCDIFIHHGWPFWVASSRVGSRKPGILADRVRSQNFDPRATLCWTNDR